MISFGVRAQVCRLWGGQEVFIFASQILLQAAVLVVVPTDGAAKILLEFVVDSEVADGVVQEVQLVHHSSGVLPLPLQLFMRVSHLTAERAYLRDILQ